jgi:hypothetical protein
MATQVERTAIVRNAASDIARWFNVTSQDEIDAIAIRIDRAVSEVNQKGADSETKQKGN